MIEEITAIEREKHQAIGRFVYEFSRLEDWLRTILQQKLDLPYDGFDVLAPGLDFAYLCNALKAVIKERGAKNPEVALRALNRCLDLNAQRVRVVHGAWYAGAAYHTSRTNLQSGEYFLDEGELDKFIDEIIIIRQQISSGMIV